MPHDLIEQQTSCQPKQPLFRASLVSNDQAVQSCAMPHDLIEQQTSCQPKQPPFYMSLVCNDHRLFKAVQLMPHVVTAQHISCQSQSPPSNPHRFDSSNLCVCHLFQGCPGTGPKQLEQSVLERSWA